MLNYYSMIIVEVRIVVTLGYRKGNVIQELGVGYFKDKGRSKMAI